MAGQTMDPYGNLTVYPRVKYVFYALTGLIFAIAVGHLYLIGGLTELYLGLPLWIWVQNVVFVGILCIAWVAVQLRAMATDGGV